MLIQLCPAPIRHRQQALCMPAHLQPMYQLKINPIAPPSKPSLIVIAQILQQALAKPIAHAPIAENLPPSLQGQQQPPVRCIAIKQLDFSSTQQEQAVLMKSRSRAFLSVPVARVPIHNFVVVP